MATVALAGVLVDNLTSEEAVVKVAQFLQEHSPRLIVTPNPEIIVRCQDDQELKYLMNGADLRVADGISMIVVSRLLGKPLKERVTGIDLMQRIIKLCSRQGSAIFLLGSAPGIANAAAAKLKEQNPLLRIVGTHDGYFKDQDEAQVIELIRNSKADLVFVGLGAGRQEKWLRQNLNKLGVKVGMVIGGSLDVISGHKQRAPQWIQALYIEWLFRLLTEPQRWQRQLALPKFLWLMFLPRRK